MSTVKPTAEQSVARSLARTADGRKTLAKMFLEADESEESSEQIGKGTFAKVYLKKRGSLVAAAKVLNLLEVPDSTEEYGGDDGWLAAMTEYISSDRMEELNIEENFDAAVMILISKDFQACPNLPLIYDYKLSIEDSVAYLHILMEAYDLTLDQFATMRTSSADSLPKDSVWDNIIFQVAAGIHSLNRRVGRVHLDLNQVNIMFQLVEPGGYWQYTIMGINYFVPNFGYRAILIDLGYAERISEKHKKDPNFLIGDGSGVEPATDWNLRDGMGNLPVIGEMVPLADDETMPQMVIGSPIGYRGVTDLELLSNTKVTAVGQFFDLQDALASLVGGHISTQWKGKERFAYPQLVPDSVKERLAHYVSPDGRRWEGWMSFGTVARSRGVIGDIDLRMLLPQYFLMDYFTRFTDYRVPKEDVIDIYPIS